MNWLARIAMILLIITAFLELRVIQHQTKEMAAIAREQDSLTIIAFKYGFVLSRHAPDLEVDTAVAEFKENLQRISDKIDKGIK